MKLDEGWNQIHFNLTDFTRRAYGTNYLETLRYTNLITILLNYLNIEFKFMPTVELEEYTLLINYYHLRKSHLNIKLLLQLKKMEDLTTNNLEEDNLEIWEVWIKTIKENEREIKIDILFLLIIKLLNTIYIN